jgi:hypothetical protein
MANFLKYGAEARQALEKAEAEQTGSYEPFRFWMKSGEEAKVTFLDGELHEDGMLAVPMFYEHRIRHNGRWTQFVCTEAQEPCPLCAADNRPALVGALTVIDHRKIEGRSKVYHMEKKLFVCKKRTIQLLTKQAEKRGGLTGVTFEVERSNDERSVSVGDNFDFVKKTDLDTIAEKLGPEKAQPFDYEQVITYRDAATLVAMGVGVAVGGSVSAPAQSTEAETSTADQIDDIL